MTFHLEAKLPPRQVSVFLMDPPFPKAGPRQVRSYLADLLVRKHDVSSESAQSIADRWQLGLGRDLRQASREEFIEVFGRPVGPYLFHSVEDDLYAEWRASSSGIINYWALGIACVAAIFFLVRACYSRTNVQAWQNLTYALFCGPIIMVGGIREWMVRLSVIPILLSCVGGLTTFFTFCRVAELIGNAL